MSENLTFFVPYHTGYAHAELVHSFSSYTDVHLFIYKWNPAYERIKNYFINNKKIHIYEFSINNIILQLIKEKYRKIVILLTASTNYLFGQLQLRLFHLIQEYFSSIIDIYSVGHCMYGCQSCAYAYTHCLPITFTNYIRTKNEKLLLDNNYDILICPSYSFINAPYSLLSNIDIIEYILTLKYSHLIKLHPLAYEYNDNHPFLSLTDLEKEHVKKLFQSKNILLNEQINTLKLIEYAHIIICDSNSSIPFETLYFQDNKYIFVYETIDEYDEQDDREKFFYKFSNVEELKLLLENYYNQKLKCKTKNSHEFFLEKYDEPNGNEIEKLVDIRQWLIKTNNEDNNKQDKIYDIDTIKQIISNKFKSISTPMTLYTLGEHTTSEIEQIFFNDDENQLFDTLQNNINEL
ncbi:unnamed protein product [Rotaria sp. Silwood1]|nr:unnamed protein product [Rotaria sp. Silwood1]CAF1164786.1 unnamed protein product [Rotaria sp. Silwood1]